jgi:hypothetical protein
VLREHRLGEEDLAGPLVALLRLGEQGVEVFAERLAGEWGSRPLLAQRRQRLVLRPPS